MDQVLEWIISMDTADIQVLPSLGSALVNKIQSCSLESWLLKQSQVDVLPIICSLIDPLQRDPCEDVLLQSKISHTMLHLLLILTRNHPDNVHILLRHPIQIVMILGDLVYLLSTRVIRDALNKSVQQEYMQEVCKSCQVVLLWIPFITDTRALLHIVQETLLLLNDAFCVTKDHEGVYQMMVSCLEVYHSCTTKGSTTKDSSLPTWDSMIYRLLVKLMEIPLDNPIHTSRCIYYATQGPLYQQWLVCLLDQVIKSPTFGWSQDAHSIQLQEPVIRSLVLFYLAVQSTLNQEVYTLSNGESIQVYYPSHSLKSLLKKIEGLLWTCCIQPIYFKKLTYFVLQSISRPLSPTHLPTFPSDNWLSIPHHYSIESTLIPWYHHVLEKYCALNQGTPFICFMDSDQLDFIWTLLEWNESRQSSPSSSPSSSSSLISVLTLLFKRHIGHAQYASLWKSWCSRLVSKLSDKSMHSKQHRIMGSCHSVLPSISTSNDSSTSPPVQSPAQSSVFTTSMLECMHQFLMDISHIYTLYSIDTPTRTRTASSCPDSSNTSLSLSDKQQIHTFIEQDVVSLLHILQHASSKELTRQESEWIQGCLSVFQPFLHHLDKIKSVPFLSTPSLPLSLSFPSRPLLPPVATSAVGMIPLLPTPPSLPHSVSMRPSSGRYKHITRVQMK